jgi:hypothetical protein
MTAAITAVVVGGVIGAGTAAYSADQQKKLAEQSAGGYNSTIQSYLDSDKEVQQWAEDMYVHGNINPWVTGTGEAPMTTPYSSTKQKGMGYYVDKNGVVVTKERYANKYKSGSKDVEKYGLTWVPVTNKDSQYEISMADGASAYQISSGLNGGGGHGAMYDTATGRALTKEEAEAVVSAEQARKKTTGNVALPSGYEWRQATIKETSDPLGQNALEEKELKFMHEIQPADQQYRADSLAANARLLAPQEASANADLSYNVADKTAATSLIPQKTEAVSAGLQHTIETTPLKTQAVRDALAMAGRNTEAEAARMAGAEVSQAFNAKQQTLGESIRRTGAVAGSGRMTGLQEDLDINRVKATAGARTAARQNARASQYNQLATAIQLI